MDNFVLRAAQRRLLESQLRRTRDVRVYQRTLAILERSRGRSVADIARMLRVSRQSVYRWLDAYCESSDPDALLDDERSGRPRRWSEECSGWLESFLKHSPVDLGYAAVNWTTPLLQHALTRCTGEEFCSRTIRRELQQGGYVWKRPRYVLLPDPEREKKTPNSPSNQAFAASLCVAC
jgi:transposase